MHRTAAQHSPGPSLRPSVRPAAAAATSALTKKLADFLVRPRPLLSARSIGWLSAPVVYHSVAAADEPEIPSPLFSTLR